MFVIRGGILLLHSSLFLSLSLTLNKQERCPTHFFGGIESTWFGLLFVFPLKFSICRQNSLGLLVKFINILMCSISHFCLIVLMVCLCFLFILLYWPRVWGLLGNFWTCLESCWNFLWLPFILYWSLFYDLVF